MIATISIVSISLDPFSGRHDAHAQDAQVAPEPQKLPPIVVTGTKPGIKRGRSEAATRTARAIPRLVVYPTTPISGAGINPDKIPASVNLVDANQIKDTGSLNVGDALQKYVPGIVVNEVAGNPFQPNVEFRGFVASPVAGTPQGLAVYQNGVRVNEAFGDTVNWDLIPTAAIKSVTVVTNNPAFGLNALGGAVNVQMKDGFNYHGAEIDTMGGSFGRIQSSAQWGKQVDNFAVYGALEGLHDDGFRNFSASDVRRFYGDVGYRNDTSEFHLNMGAADNHFGATATAPVELLQQYWGATYTTPQTTENRVGYFNLTGKVEATPTWTIDGSVHVRVFDQKMLDANPTGTQPCTADQTLLCFGDGSTPANGLNGAQLANPFDPAAVLGEIDRTTTHSTTSGCVVAGDQYRSVVRPQQSFRGRHQFRFQRDPLHGQRRTRHHRPELCRQRQRIISRPVRRSRSRSGRSRCAPPTSTADFMRSIPSTSPMRSRSPAAAASTSPISGWKTRSAAR